MQAFKVILVIACLAGIALADILGTQNIDAPIGRFHKKSQWGTTLTCEEFVGRIKKSLPIVLGVMVVGCKTDPQGETLRECVYRTDAVIEYVADHTPKEVCQNKEMFPRRHPSLDIASADIPDTQNIGALIGHFQKKLQLGITITCEEFVRLMHKYLPDLLGGMVDFCKIYPQGETIRECIDRTEAVIEWVADQSPQEVCRNNEMFPRKRAFFDLAPLQEPKCSLLCEPCKQIAQQLKAGAPQAKDQLKKMCKNCGAPDNVKKCEEAIDKFIDDIEKKSPEELCIEIGLCKKQ